MARCLTAFGVWLGFMALIVVCAVVREALGVPLLGPQLGRAMAAMAVCLGLITMITAYMRAWGRQPWGRLFVLGLFWAGLTVAAEAAWTAVALGRGWPLALADYRVVEGSLWPLAAAVMLLWPLIAGRLGQR